VSHSFGRALLPVAAAGVALAAAAVAQGSICVCRAATESSLRISASGYAEVGWTTRDGHRRYAVVTPGGRVMYGDRIRRDASRAARAGHVPFREAVRQTPDGRWWALQRWRPRASGKAEVRFSRWRGKGTSLTSRTTCCRNGSIVIRGRATLNRRPVFGSQATGSGSVRIGVFVDCFRCALNPRGWARATRVPTRAPDGSYSVRIRPRWMGLKYRITMTGPNLRWTRAPDARSLVRHP
jgi:hypothetical protein